MPVGASIRRVKNNPHNGKTRNYAVQLTNVHKKCINKRNLKFDVITC